MRQAAKVQSHRFELEKTKRRTVMLLGVEKWLDPNAFCLRWILAWIWLMRWELRRCPSKGCLRQRFSGLQVFQVLSERTKSRWRLLRRVGLNFCQAVFGPTLWNPKLESPNTILCLSKTLLHGCFFGMHYAYIYIFGNRNHHHRPVLRLCQTLAYTASQQLRLHKRRKPI